MEVEKAELVERSQRVEWAAEVKGREGENDDAFAV